MTASKEKKEQLMFRETWTPEIHLKKEACLYYKMKCF